MSDIEWPELPKGYRWHIYNDRHHTGLRIEKKKWWSWERVTGITLYSHYGKDDIESSAKWLLKDWQSPIPDNPIDKYIGVTSE